MKRRKRNKTCAGKSPALRAIVSFLTSASLQPIQKTNSLKAVGVFPFDAKHLPGPFCKKRKMGPPSSRKDKKHRNNKKCRFNKFPFFVRVGRKGVLLLELAFNLLPKCNRLHLKVLQNCEIKKDD